MILTHKKRFFLSFFGVFLFFNLHLSAQPHCGFQLDLGEDLNLNLGDSWELLLVSSIPETAIASVSWMPPDSLSCTDCFVTLASPTEDICYIATVTDTTGCAISDTVCIFLLPTSTRELDVFQKLEIFPNPMTDIVFIKGLWADRIKVYDFKGRIVLTVKNTNRVDCSMLKAGIYFFEIEKEGNRRVEKVIKK